MASLERILVKTASETGLSLEEVAYLMQLGIEKVANTPTRIGFLSSLKKTWDSQIPGGKVNIGGGIGAAALLGYLMGMKANRVRY